MNFENCPHNNRTVSMLFASVVLDCLDCGAYKVGRNPWRMEQPTTGGCKCGFLTLENIDSQMLNHADGFQTTHTRELCVVEKWKG